MEAIDYVKLFKLDQENYDFKREEFISELGNEFLDYCQTTTIGINPKTHKLYYYRFKEIVKNFETKFWAISKLKLGEPFTQKLWNAFFATQVVPLRTQLFPDIQKMIEELPNFRARAEYNRSKQDKNLRTVKRQTMAREITDLHGNKFKVGDYKLCLNIPITGKGNLVFTRDLISGEPFNLSVSKKNIRDISIIYL